MSLSKNCQLTAVPIKRKMATTTTNPHADALGSFVSQGLFYPANFLNLLQSSTRVILGMHLHNTHPHHQTQLLDSPLALVPLFSSLHTHAHAHTHSPACQLKQRRTQRWKDESEGSNVLWDYVIFFSSSTWAMIWGRTRRRNLLQLSLWESEKLIQLKLWYKLISASDTREPWTTMSHHNPPKLWLALQMPASGTD